MGESSIEPPGDGSESNAMDYNELMEENKERSKDQAKEPEESPKVEKPLHPDKDKKDDESYFESAFDNQ